MNVGFATDPGKTRELNEDSLYINEEIGLFVLADGMGGHNAGEIASRIAVIVIGLVVEEELDTATDVEELLRAAVQRANGVIVEKSHSKAAWTEMGATVVVALVREDRVVVAHVGDSRAYMIGRGQIKPLTEDHTFVAEWLREGSISKEEARTHPARHGLIESLGITEDVEIDVGVWPRDVGDRLALCSDGLTDMIEDREILAIVESSSDPQEVCARLIHAANRAGGKDNITAIVVCS